MTDERQNQERNPAESQRVDKFTRELAIALERILGKKAAPLPEAIKAHPIPPKTEDNTP